MVVLMKIFVEELYTSISIQMFVDSINQEEKNNFIKRLDKLTYPS